MQRFTLRDHRKQLTCTHCGKSFSRLRGLKEHMSVHSGERPFKCTLCDARFRKSKQLTTHVRLHSGKNRISAINVTKHSRREDL